MNRRSSVGIVAGIAVLLTSGLVLAMPWASGAAPAAAGKLVVSFLYMPPSEIEPTYHTAMWLEDKDGKMVKTLFVSQELSVNEYKQGIACPTWIKQSSWAKADKSVVDAVTGPTPNVGSGTMSFDLNQLGIAPGSYRFCFQVHIVDKYNVLFRGAVDVGQAAQEVKIEELYSPNKPGASHEIVRDVYVQYVPAEGK